MVRRHRQRLGRPRLARKLRQGDSFSLLELVVVISVLATLAAISLPFFQSLIKQAAYVAGQWSLSSATTTCSANKTLPIPTGFFGTRFSSSNSSDVCNGSMTASFDGGCQISIDLKNGNKTSSGIPGWPKSLDECSNQSQLASTPENSNETEDSELSERRLRAALNPAAESPLECDWSVELASHYSQSLSGYCQSGAGSHSIVQCLPEDCSFRYVRLCGTGKKPFQRAVESLTCEEAYGKAQAIGDEVMYQYAIEYLDEKGGECKKSIFKSIDRERDHLINNYGMNFGLDSELNCLVQVPIGPANSESDPYSDKPASKWQRQYNNLLYFIEAGGRLDKIYKNNFNEKPLTVYKEYREARYVDGEFVYGPATEFELIDLYQ